MTGSRSAVGMASDSRARVPGFDTRSGHILSFLLPLTQEGQLSVTKKNVPEVLVNRLGGLSPPRKSVVRLTDRPDMTIDVYREVKQQSNNNKIILKCARTCHHTDCIFSSVFCLLSIHVVLYMRRNTI